MKATIDIPDDLYRMVKARSALEGRPLRAVVVQLFESWVRSGNPPTAAPPDPTPEEFRRFPWLAISRRYHTAGLTHDMDEIRASIAGGRAAESASEIEKGHDSP
jgi:hypothetical protein